LIGGVLVVVMFVFVGCGDVGFFGMVVFFLFSSLGVVKVECVLVVGFDFVVFDDDKKL